MGKLHLCTVVAIDVTLKSALTFIHSLGVVIPIRVYFCLYMIRISYVLNHYYSKLTGFNRNNFHQ